MIHNNLPSYAIVIVTYGRPEVVQLSIKCSLAQTIQPKQIIIVDASPDSEQQRQRVQNELVVPENVEFKYVTSSRPSIAYQRNQGIKHCGEVDVVFFIDDDTFLYEDCAEVTLKLYGADKSKSIAGVQLDKLLTPPELVSAASSAMASKNDTNDSPFRRKIEQKLRVVWRQLFLMSPDLNFIPYDGVYHSKVDPILEDGSTYPAIPLFDGCRMTYRLDAISKEGFESDLVTYAAAEDLDASYRASRYGTLVECAGARMYHKTVDASRVNRYRSLHMASLNIACFVYKNSNNIIRDRIKYIILTLRRLFAELLKDTLSRRFTYPQFRGLVKGSIQGMMLLFSRAGNNNKIRDLQSQFLQGK